MANNKKQTDNKIVELLKEEIALQIEPQDQITDFQFEEIPIKVFTPEISKLFEQYQGLTSIEFTSCELISLDGFPKIPNLIKLGLEQNHLDGRAIKYIADHFSSLQFLSLSGNKIDSLNDLKPLSKLVILIQLDFQDTLASQDQNYRKTLFEICPSLQILDNMDKDGIQVNYSDNNSSVSQKKSHLFKNEEDYSEDDSEEDLNEEYLNEDDDNANGQNFGYKEYDSDDDDLGGPKLEKKRK